MMLSMSGMSAVVPAGTVFLYECKVLHDRAGGRLGRCSPIGVSASGSGGKR